jgi:uncharacterized membrane protein
VSLPDAPESAQPGVAAPPEAAADSAPAGTPTALARAADRALRVAGAVLAVAMALLTGLLELYLSPLRAGGMLLGVAAIVAIPVNIGLAWFAQRAVGTRFAFGWPWTAWTLLMFVAAGVRTDEGDQLLAGDNWVGLLLILTGSVAFAGYAYRAVLDRAPRG